MTRAPGLLVSVAVVLAAGAVSIADPRPTTPPADAPPAPVTPPATPRAQVVVGLQAGAADLAADAQRVAALVGGVVVDVCAPLSYALVDAPGDGPTLASALAAAPGVAWTEVNRSATTAAGPGRCTCQGASDRLPPAPDVHDLAGAAAAIRLAEAWDEVPGRGAGVLVGVVDTGVDPACAALQGACDLGVDLVAPGGPALDEHGHGTGMAAVIAGRGDGETTGFLGVAPGARILPVRVADARGEAPLDRVARGIVAAAERGARVVYVGLGVRGRSPLLAAAVEQARRAGALVVAPAGNDALDQVRSPAAERGALGVAGARDDGRHLALCTNLGAEAALCAPAERVPAPYRDRVCFTEGTSSAAALTAGVAALALSRAPALDPAGLERCVRAGARPLPHVQGTVLAERLPLVSLDAPGVVARAAADHAEVQVTARLVPAVPVAGRPARLELVVTNAGQVPLTRVDLSAAAGRGRVDDLAPGATQTVSFTLTPAEGPGRVDVEACGVPRPTDAGPAAPCVARARAEWTATAAPQASFAIVGARLLAPVTLEGVARFEVTVENRGSAPGEGSLLCCVDGARALDATVSLEPGARASREVVATVPPARLSSPVQLEAGVVVAGDPREDDDVDTLMVAVQDPSLPLDPQYRQAGDIDIAVDAPWRLAADRPYLPLLVFVPSIGRPSKYTTFHEDLAMRRGAVNPLRPRRRRSSTVRARTMGDLTTFTAAHFIKELASATQGEEAAVRRFFDQLMTSDFAIDYSLYAVGAAGGRRGFDLVAKRAKTLPGLRWTGTSLGGAIARSQCAIAAGYLLPNLVRGRLDRRVAIDLASLGLTSAAAEAVTHGATRAAVRTSLGRRTAAFLARHGRIARTGAWALDVGQLVLVLYASEWISETVERPLIRRDARRALQAAWRRLREATRGDDEAEFQAALDELDDAFDAYRNLVVEELELALKELNDRLRTISRKVHQTDAVRARTERIPERLAASRDRVLERTEREADSMLGDALHDFEERFAHAVDSLLLGRSGPGHVSTLSDPGTSKPALFDLQVRLLAELEGAARPERAAALRARRETVLRLKALDAAVLTALAEGTSPEAGAVVEDVAGTDGLMLRRVSVTARDTWHEPTADADALRADPLRHAPAGWVRTERLYEHDSDRDHVRAAPGVQRVDEDGAVQEVVTLFDTPRPLTVKGRYNILRLPRAALERLAVGGAAGGRSHGGSAGDSSPREAGERSRRPHHTDGGAVFVEVELDWDLQKVVRGALLETARGQHAQMLRVQLGGPGLPAIPSLQGGYLDAHYHTIAEWYNPEPGFVSNLELDAPRQKYGGPVPMLVESAYAIGALEAPTFEAARDRLVTTDHGCFYVDSDELAHRPPFGPTSARASDGRGEHARMRELLGESVGEELCYGTPGLTSVGAHMLDFRARHYDGTWNGKEPLGRLVRRLTSPLDLPTLERVLDDFARATPGNERAFAYAAHPVSSIPWSDADLERALAGYARLSDKSFAFRGLQVWNTRPAREHSLEKLHKFIDDLNPFTERAWQAGRAHEEEVHASLAKYRRLLQAFAATRHPADPTVRFVRKHYVVAGSDAHGDFNYTLGGLATVITAWVGLNDRTEHTLELNDNAFMRVRTFVATEGHEAPAHMNALARGTSVITDGPLVWFEVDGDGHLDARTGDYDLAAAPRFRDREGRIGGQGAFDGGRTVLVANDAVPVVRYSYANHDEFGAPVEKDDLGRPLRTDGALEAILVHKTDSIGEAADGWAARGRLDVRGGRAFGQPLTEALDVTEEGPVRGVSAIQLEAVTRKTSSPADVYRCVTNPVWAVHVEVVAHLDPRRFDAARGVILPGGLAVALRSPVSLAPDRVRFALQVLDGGKSGQALVTLEPEGWAAGRDEAGRPYKGGVLRVTNRAEVVLRGLPRWSPPGEGHDPARWVTLVARTTRPLRDAFGNQLNAVAAWFEVDPRTGAPGRHADAATELPAVSLDPPRSRGIIDALPDGQ